MIKTKPSWKPSEASGTDSKADLFYLTRIRLAFFYICILVCFVVVSNLLLYHDFPHYFIQGKHVNPHELLYARSALRLTIFSLDVSDIMLFLVMMAMGYFLANLTVARMNQAATRQKYFIAEASHELRTPLTIMKTTLEVALKGKKEETDETFLLKSFLEDINRLSAIVEDLLFLSQNDEGIAHYELTPSDLLSCLEQVKRTVTPYAKLKKVKFSTNGLVPVPILADNQKLYQALLNIVKNAIDYTKVNGRVTLALHKQARFAVVTVKDTGIGIPQNDVPFIFDRFYRSKSSHAQRKEGTGLGLAIAKSIIQYHKGSIVIKSSPGKGTTATIYLPIQKK